MAGNYMTFITEDIFMHIKENATGIQHIGIPTKDMDADDLQSFNMLKGIMVQLPEIMNKTTTFELGLELIK